MRSYGEKLEYDLVYQPYGDQEEVVEGTLILQPTYVNDFKKADVAYGHSRNEQEM